MFPRWRKPVGLGANRVRTSDIEEVQARGTDCTGRCNPSRRMLRGGRLPAQVKRRRRRGIYRFGNDRHRAGSMTVSPEARDAARLGLVGIHGEGVVMAA